MSYNSRRTLTPGPSRKRKERENHQFHQHHQQPFYFSNIKPSSARAEKAAVAVVKPSSPVSSNRLLAGCMAHEFLTKGTLFGQKFDPARAEAVPVGYGSGSGSAAEPKKPGERGSYAEVASLLMKADGAHVPGVFNPTQLARWIQM